MPCSRRAFLAGALAAGAPGLSRAVPASRPPVQEPDWAEVAREWAATPGQLNLESGGVQPVPLAVNEVFRRAWADATRLPPAELARVQVPALEEVRRRLAAASGFAPDEIALVRNTTEGLQNLLLGWPLVRGDRVLTTTQDYWRFQDGLDQRAAREGIEVDRIRLPVPLRDAASVVDSFVAALRPETRVVLVSEMINLTGQILPVAAIAAAMRARGVAVLIDGAHGFGHLTAQPDTLGADGYATSLHKWLGAPHGTGFLALRRRWIGEVWPLFPALASRREDIRKFEGWGTFAAAPFLAIPAALDFWRRIGPEAKLARLRWLRDRWLQACAGDPRVQLLTRTAEEGAGAIATVELRGQDPRLIAEALRVRDGIFVRAIAHPEFRGLRVTPNLFNSAADLDRFAERLRVHLDAGG